MRVWSGGERRMKRVGVLMLVLKCTVLLSTNVANLWSSHSQSDVYFCTFGQD